MESQKKEDDGKIYWNVIVEDVELIGSKNNEQTEQKQELTPIEDDTLPF